MAEGEDWEKAELSKEELDTVRNSESIDGEEDFLLMILEILSKNLTEKLTKIEEGAEAADMGTVWKEAHSIKGSALQCSLNALGEAAKAVELKFKELEKGDGYADDEDKAAQLALIKTLREEGTKVQNTTAKLREAAGPDK